MPVRKTPRSAAGDASPRNPISLHLMPFLHYLEAECGLARNTVHAYGSDLKQFAVWYCDHGPANPNEITLQILTSYIHELRKRELAATTVARHLVAVRMLFRYMVLEGLLEKSVAESLSSPKLWQYLPKVLGPAAVERLLNAPDRSDRFRLRDRALLCLLYATGCRASEVANLRLSKVFLDERYAR